MIKIKIDDHVLFKGEVGEWASKAPDEFRNAINPEASPQPYMKAVLIAMADVVMNHQQSATITVRTKLPGVKRGWTMEVAQ